MTQNEQLQNIIGTVTTINYAVTTINYAVTIIRSKKTKEAQNAGLLRR